jgi:hypothetical protein
MKRSCAAITALSLATLALQPFVDAQSCGAGTHTSTISVTNQFGPASPSWSNIPLEVPQFSAVAGQSLVQAEISLIGSVSGETQFEHLATQPSCTINWCLGSSLHVQIPMPSPPPLDAAPQFCGSNLLATFDGTLDYGGTSGVTNIISPTFQTATVTITDPAVLASVFTGSGNITLTTSATDTSTHSGCPNLAAIFINDTEIIVNVVYTYCSPGQTICVPGGQGATIVCPCGNPQSPAGSLKGCNNSSATGGAVLSSGGASLLSADTVVFTTSGENPNATSVVLQGNASNPAGATFGQGVRCASGTLLRLYVKHASGGSIVAPEAGDPTVSARSAALGDTILPNQARYYLVHYRDPIVLGGCPSTSTFNATQGQVMFWAP